MFNNGVVLGALPDRHLLPDLRGGVHQLAGEDDPHCESELPLSLSLSPQFYLSPALDSRTERNCQQQKLTIETSLFSGIKIQNFKIFNPIPAEFRCRYHQPLVLSSEIIGNRGLPGVHVRDGNDR